MNEPVILNPDFGNILVIENMKNGNVAAMGERYGIMEIFKFVSRVHTELHLMTLSEYIGREAQRAVQEDKV